MFLLVSIRVSLVRGYFAYISEPPIYCRHSSHCGAKKLLMPAFCHRIANNTMKIANAIAFGPPNQLTHAMCSAGFGSIVSICPAENAMLSASP